MPNMEVAVKVACMLVHFAAQVLFNFSSSVVEISEGGNLQSQLYITKTGEYEGNISIHVSVSPITPNNNGMCSVCRRPGNEYVIKIHNLQEIFITSLRLHSQR